MQAAHIVDANSRHTAERVQPTAKSRLWMQSVQDDVQDSVYTVISHKLHDCILSLLKVAAFWQVLRALIESYASEVGAREVTSLVSELLPVLIDKAGDNNTRIRYVQRQDFRVEGSASIGFGSCPGLAARKKTSVPSGGHDTSFCTQKLPSGSLGCHSRAKVVTWSDRWCAESATRKRCHAPAWGA